MQEPTGGGQCTSAAKRHPWPACCTSLRGSGSLPANRRPPRPGRRTKGRKWSSVGGRGQRVGPGCGSSAGAFRSPRAKGVFNPAAEFQHIRAGSRAPPKNSARLCVMLPEPTTSALAAQAAQGSAHRIHLCRARPRAAPPAPRHIGRQQCIIGTQAPWSNGRAASPCAAMPAAPATPALQTPMQASLGPGTATGTARAESRQSRATQRAARQPSPGDRAIQWGRHHHHAAQARNCAFSPGPSGSAPAGFTGLQRKQGAPCDTNRQARLQKRGRKSGRMRGHGTPLVSIRTVEEIARRKSRRTRTDCSAYAANQPLRETSAVVAAARCGLAAQSPPRTRPRSALVSPHGSCPPGGAAAHRTVGLVARRARGNGSHRLHQRVEPGHGVSQVLLLAAKLLGLITTTPSCVMRESCKARRSFHRLWQRRGPHIKAQMHGA